MANSYHRWNTYIGIIMEIAQIEESIQYLKQYIDDMPEIAIILGSGLGPLANELENKTIINCSDIPNYPISTVPDHAGIWVLGELNGIRLLVLKGRVHTYEGYSARRVTYSIRLMAKLGIRSLIITNAAGGINKNFKPGDLMIITDHINLMFDNPLIGDNQVPASQRFVDLYNAYDKKYIEGALKIAKKLDIQIQTGILSTAKGPTYETAAEVKMSRLLGADAATMSTVPEVIAAKQDNVRTLGISCITNMATGITNEKLNHEEVQETANRIKHQFIQLIKEIIKNINEW